jgi:predicted negative regulator of RcsB-dependent stress response
MAALDLQEQEQLEELKGWWKDNGNYVLGLVLVAVLAVGGWRGWQYYQHKQSFEASTLYAEFGKQLQSGDAKRVNDAAAALMDKYPKTVYAANAGLMAAQVNELAGNGSAQAHSQLQWVLDHASDTALKDVARLRLAALLLDDKKFDDALKLLTVKHAESFDALYADLRGDVLMASGKRDEARSAYKLAYEKIDEKSSYRNLIEMKLDATGAAQ